MQRLYSISRLKLSEVNSSFKRYLLDEIDLNNKLIAVKGAKGVGKTTMLLQMMKQTPLDESLYVSLDDIYFSENKLVYFAEDFYSKGGKYLFIDEVHKYPNWSQEFKNIYDNLSQLKVVFTSSSALDMRRGMFDLSRRLLVYELHGLSFREFMNFKYGIELPACSLADVLKNPRGLIDAYLEKFKPLKYFEEYLFNGYYPYFIEDEKTYHIRLREAVNVVIEAELPQINNIDYSSVLKLKKLMYVMSSLVPYEPNINKLAAHIGATRDSLLKLLQLLHNAHIMKWLSSDPVQINFLNKPDKLYLENTNLMFALSDRSPDKGNLRETFFLNQVSVSNTVCYSKTGDFLVNDTSLFEIGGKSKSFKQIANIENSFVAADDIEFNFGNKIPLWLFGMMY